MKKASPKQEELVGVIGGLGSKASSTFYDSYIVEGRIKLFEAMKSARDALHRHTTATEISTAPWKPDEIDAVWRHSASQEKLTDQDHIPILIYSNSQISGKTIHFHLPEI